MKPTNWKRSQLVWVTLAALSLIVHVSVVLSIARQPLAVHERPESRARVCSLFHDACHRFGPGVDLFAVYNAAQGLQSGTGLYGYDMEPRTPYFYSFRYLPIVAQALGPILLQLSPLTAYRLWILVLELTLAALLGLFVLVSRGWIRWFGVCTLLVSSPFFLELHVGQFTFLATALVAAPLWINACSNSCRARRWRRWIAISLYTCSVLLKAFTIAAAVPLLRVRSRWLCFGIVVVSVIVLSAPYFTVHPEELAMFRKVNFESKVGPDGGNFGFAYLLYLVVRDTGAQFLLENRDVVFTIWRTAILLITSILVLSSRREQFDLSVSAMLLAHFIGYIHVWEHHISAIVVIGLICMRALAQQSHLPRWPLVATATCIVLLVVPTPFALLDPPKDPRVWDPFRRSADWVHYALVAPKALPTMALYLICAFGLARDGFRWHSGGHRSARYGTGVVAPQTDKDP